MQEALTLRTMNSESWLNGYREKNRKIFEARPLKKSKYTSIAKLEELLQHSGNPRAETTIEPKDAAIVLTIKESLVKMPELVKRALQSEKTAKDQFEAFVNANFDNGSVIILGKQANGKTLHIKTRLARKSCTKNIIIVEEGVRVFLVEEIGSDGGSLCSETVLLEKGAGLGIARIHEETGGTISYQQCLVEKDAELSSNNSWFGGELVRANTTNIMLGEGAKAVEYSLLLSKGKQHFDLNYTSAHYARDTYSHCIFNSVLKDDSRAVFDGMILIEHSADKANALLECHSMILGERASSNQIPGLEIKTDDVKATHSATVARLEEEELFYLQAKGIPREAAKKMVVKSFLESITFLLPKNLKMAIEKKIEDAV